MKLDRIINIKQDVLSQEVSQETVLLDLKGGEYFGLDSMGTEIWALIKEHGDMQLIFDTLLEQFDVDHDQLIEDFDEFVNHLDEAGLIEIKSKSI